MCGISKTIEERNRMKIIDLKKVKERIEKKNRSILWTKKTVYIMEYRIRPYMEL